MKAFKVSSTLVPQSSLLIYKHKGCCIVQSSNDSKKGGILVKLLPFTKYVNKRPEKPSALF